MSAIKPPTPPSPRGAQKPSIQAPPRSGSKVGCKAWRQERLAILCRQALAQDEASGMPARGSARRMAGRLGLAPTALSNMVHGAKNIGDEAARSIERSLGLDPGSLDAPAHCVPCANEQERAALASALAAMRLAGDGPA